MIDAIKAKPKVEVDPSTIITNDKFESMIREVYDVMLNYTRISGEALTKHHPILVGNVTFWFGVDDSGTDVVQFEPSISMWKEDNMIADIQRHNHDLYYNPMEQ